MRPGSSTVSLEVPAMAGYVLLARLALGAVCRLAPLSPEGVADLKLAVTEAASAFIGEGDADAERLDAPDSATGARDDAVLAFAFELAEDRLVVDVRCNGGVAVPDEERELSRAIIAATVDDCEYDDAQMRLVKYLREPG